VVFSTRCATSGARHRAVPAARSARRRSPPSSAASRGDAQAESRVRLAHIKRIDPLAPGCTGAQPGRPAALHRLAARRQSPACPALPAPCFTHGLRPPRLSPIALVHYHGHGGSRSCSYIAYLVLQLTGGRHHDRAQLPHHRPRYRPTGALGRRASCTTASNLKLKNGVAPHARSQCAGSTWRSAATIAAGQRPGGHNLCQAN